MPTHAEIRVTIVSVAILYFAVPAFAFDLRCFIAKGSPFYWQAKIALEAARQEGLIRTEASCNDYRQRAENFDPATREAVKIMGACLCEEVFGCGVGPVVVYEHENFMGKCRAYEHGRYYADRHTLRIANKTISSLRVRDGWRVRLCDAEGRDDTGAGFCATYDTGEWQFSAELNDKVSYISVWPAQGQEAPVPRQRTQIDKH